MSMATVVELRRRTRALEEAAGSVGGAGLASASAAGAADWTRSPRLHHGVRQALALAQSIEKQLRQQQQQEEEQGDGEAEAGGFGGGAGSAGSATEEDERVLADCKGRLDALSSQLRRMDLPSFARTEASLAASSKSRGGPVPSTAASAGGWGAGLSVPASPRSAVTVTRIPGAVYSSLGGKKRVGSGNRDVDLHQQLHEDMTSEILQMAKGLKQNALKFT